MPGRRRGGGRSGGGGRGPGGDGPQIPEIDEIVEKGGRVGGTRLAEGPVFRRVAEYASGHDLEADTGLAFAALADAEADDANEGEDDTPENKDDTGVGNPWGLANDEDEDDGVHASGAGSTGLLTKVG